MKRIGFGTNLSENLEKMWLDLAIAMSCGGGGLVCGWIMHAIGGFGNHTLVRQAAASITQSEAGENDNDGRINEVAEKLKSYVLSMAAHVDAHQTKVQAVNNSLIASGESSPEEVFAAVNQLISANQKMQTQLQQAQDQIHEQAVQIESAEQRATTDPLTRVPNRGAFDKHLANRHAMGPGRAGTLALLDVDHFKKFNDVYGHRAGDEVLRVVAKLLHARLQKYGLVARYGGEEFVVILDGFSTKQANDLIESARVAIGEREIHFEDKTLRVSASAGVAELVDPESTEQWLQRADDAMYQSKKAGRDCAHWMDGTEPRRIKRGNSTEALNDSTRSANQDSATPDAARAGGSAKAGNATPDTPEIDLGIAPSTAESSGKPDPSAFAYLPDRETLGVSFNDLRGRTQSSVALFVMAIRCHESATKASMRSLLQIVRAALRSVDRIGCDDDQTLLVCMPSVDEATALDRGQQICRSARAIGLGKQAENGNQIAIGIADTRADEEFSDVVSRAVLLAQQASTDEENPVSVDSRGISV